MKPASLRSFSSVFFCDFRGLILSSLLAVGCVWPSSSPAQTQVDDLTEQIQELDAKIEATIDDLAARLERVKDSPDSGGRVAKVKKDFMADLEKSINLYRLERDKRIDKIGRPGTVPAMASLQHTTESLDARIDTRADAIVAIAQSFNESDGYRDYITVYDDDGMSSNDHYESEDSIQKRREGSRATQNVKAVIEGLQRSIADLDQRRAMLERRLASATTDENRKALKTEIDRIAAKRTARLKQIDELGLEVPNAVATTSLSSDQAFALDKEVDALVKELHGDFRELLRLANEREVARARGP
jgi:hypothetical protein